MTTGWRPSFGTITTWVILIAVVFAIWMKIPPSANSSGDDVAWWMTAWEFINEYGLYLMIGVPILMFGVGLKQRWSQHSWAGDAMHYLLGGGSLIIGLLVIVVGPQLTGDILTAIRGGAQKFVQCQLGDLSGDICAFDTKAFGSAAAFGVFAIIGIVAAWKVKIIAGAWAIAGTALILPLAFFYALGALPEDYKTAIEEVVGATPLVTTPLEQQAAADKAAAELKAAEAKRLARLAELERQRVAALEPEWSLCTLPEFSKFTSCFRVTVKRGGPPFRITKVKEENCIARNDTRWARADPSGLTVAYYHNVAARNEATFHVFEMTPNQTYRNATGTIKC